MRSLRADDSKTRTNGDRFLKNTSGTSRQGQLLPLKGSSFNMRDPEAPLANNFMASAEKQSPPRDHQALNEQMLGVAKQGSQPINHSRHLEQALNKESRLANIFSGTDPRNGQKAMLSLQNKRKFITHQKKSLRNAVREHKSQVMGDKRSANKDYIDFVNDPLLNHLHPRKAEKEKDPRHASDNGGSRLQDLSKKSQRSASDSGRDTQKSHR